jgi:hypothetical protein
MLAYTDTDFPALQDVHSHLQMLEQLPGHYVLAYNNAGI